MPQLYNNAVITDAGLSLLDKVQAGTASIQFTRMAAGDGTYATNEKTSSALKRCTGLRSQKNSYPLSSVSTAPGGGVRLTALITNQDPATGATLVDEGYHINEIGLFAKEKGGADSTEVLYSITVSRGDTGDYMPPYENSAPVQIVQEYHAKVGNAAEVAISCTGAVMLVEDAQREFEDLKRMIGEAGAIGDKTLTFERAKERDNIASGETLDEILGKIEKNFADLRKIAFTGSYADLTDKPDIPSTPSDIGAASKTELAEVATSGRYSDLIGKPLFPTSLPASGGDADTVDGKHASDLLDYNNLTNRPSIPTTLPASNVTSTYSSTGTDPVNGKAVTEALKTLDVASKGGAGKYIQSISETDGKISAVEATMPTSLPADGGNAATVGGKTAAELLNYNNLTNRPVIQDDLGSTDPGDVLSAKQGYLLANGSARDDTKVKKSGDTMDGLLISNKGILVNDYSLETRWDGYYTAFLTSKIDSDYPDFRMYLNGNPGICLSGTGLYILSRDAKAYKNIVCGTITQSSALRFKENISVITGEESRGILDLIPKHFDYINGDKDQAGFIAEEVEKIYPSICVYGDDISSDGDEERLIGLNYSAFIPYIVRFMQEQEDEIRELRSQLAGLRGSDGQ